MDGWASTPIETEPPASAITLLHDPARGVGAASAIDDARYERRSVLGVGGMGELELCLDRRVGREVARKRLGGADRFAREALVQARLEHPAIVPVYDMALESPERAWCTMKRIHGRSLHEVLVALREGDARSTTPTRAAWCTAISSRRT